MSEQCDACETPSAPRTARCPINGKRYKAVGFNTVLHHVRRPWERRLTEQGYYFCTDPDCEVVYFGEDDSTLSVDELRMEVGHKSSSDDRPLCYCFDITYADIQTRGDEPRDFVVERTRDGSCDCAIRNPSGRCCLKDFPE